MPSRLLLALAVLCTASGACMLTLGVLLLLAGH
jgi:hypothetical protein